MTSKGRGRRRGTEGRGKAAKKRTRDPGARKEYAGASTEERRERRARERFAKHYHSEERVRFVRYLPCVCGGLGRPLGCHGLSHNSHDPTKGAGGTYLDVHPASVACHRLIEANDFWHRVPISREEANADTQARWLAFSEGLTY